MRIVQGRVAYLNRYSNAEYERKSLRHYLMDQHNQQRGNGSDAGGLSSTQRIPLGNLVYEQIKSVFDELLYENGEPA